jgi:hypothetical protein
MNVPTIRPARPPAFELLQRQLNLSCGDDFGAARRLLGLIEAAAPLMNELDRLQLARIMSATAHSITLTCEKRDHR